jgi:hypothetical protein
MIAAVQAAFSRYGRAVQIVKEDTAVESVGFLQRIGFSSDDEPLHSGPLGTVDTRCWLYLGTADVPVDTGDHILCDGLRYIVRDAAPVFVGPHISHYRAVVRMESGAMP